MNLYQTALVALTISAFLNIPLIIYIIRLDAVQKAQQDVLRGLYKLLSK